MIKNQEITEQDGLGGFRRESLLQEAETAIREARKTIDYNTTEFPLEYFILKDTASHIDKISQQEIDNNLNWDKSQQSYFIESLLLGLPVLNVVINDNDNDDELKIVDGKQRLYTAINFIQGNLELQNLKTLSSLNSFGFNDLLPTRQRKFKRISVRAIAVSPDFDLSVWREYR